MLAQIAAQTIYAVALFAALVFTLERAIRALLGLIRSVPAERAIRANEVVWSGLPVLFLIALLYLSPPHLHG